MPTLDLLRPAREHNGSILPPRRPSRFPLDYEGLESRQLLSGVAGAVANQTGLPVVIGPTGGAGIAPTSIGALGSGVTVQTTGAGSFQFLQPALPASDLLSSASSSSVNVVATPGQLLTLPITALEPPTVTGEETPLNNGTSLGGTVWITPPPLTPGVAHPVTLSSAPTINSLLAPPNSPVGPPSTTHFGQGGSSQIGAGLSDMPAAVGPETPNVLDKVEPPQPPAVETQPPPAQPSQQPETPAPQDEVTPKKPGAPAPQPPGAAGQPQKGGAPGHEAIPAPPQGGGAPGQSGGAVGGSGTSPGGSNTFSSGPSALLIPPAGGLQQVSPSASTELIDAALFALASSQADQTAYESESADGLATLFGAALLVTGGYQIALRRSDRLEGSWVPEPPESKRTPARGFGFPSLN